MPGGSPSLCLIGEHRKKICRKTQEAIAGMESNAYLCNVKIGERLAEWPIRLTVRTSDSQSGNRSSILLSATKKALAGKSPWVLLLLSLSISRPEPLAAHALMAGRGRRERLTEETAVRGQESGCAQPVPSELIARQRGLVCGCHSCVHFPKDADVVSRG